MARLSFNLRGRRDYAMPIDIAQDLARATKLQRQGLAEQAATILSADFKN